MQCVTIAQDKIANNTCKILLKTFQHSTHTKDGKQSVEDSSLCYISQRLIFYCFFNLHTHLKPFESKQMESPNKIYCQ